MALTAAQQALVTFKKVLGKASTGLGFDFFEEASTSRPAVILSQIWAQSDLIPNTAPGSSAGVVEVWTDEPTTAVLGASNAFQSPNLIDAIPFNFGDGVSYNYALKDGLGNSIPFGVGNWVVDPDSGTITFYSTVPANMPPTISFFKYVGTKGAAAGGGGSGGGSPLIWEVIPSQDAPASDDSAHSPALPVFKFNKDVSQSVRAVVLVPADYVAGTQIFLKNLMFACSAITGDVFFRAYVQFYRASSGLQPSGAHISGNVTATVSGTANELIFVGDMDLTDAAGLCSTDAVAPADLIYISLYRDVGNETSSAQADADLVRLGGTVTFS